MMGYFWLFFVVGVLTWYAITTIVVAVKGTRDIRSMLRRLAAKRLP